MSVLAEAMTANYHAGLRDGRSEAAEEVYALFDRADGNLEDLIEAWLTGTGQI